MTMVMMFRPRRFWSELRMELKVRWVRLTVLNAALHMSVRYAVIAVLIGILVGQQAAARRASGNSNESPVLVALQAALFPWETGPRRRWNVLSRGLEVQTYQHFPITRQRVDLVRRQPLIRSSASSYGAYAACLSIWGFLVVLLAPLGMAALPISRRVAKVRWRHLTRIWLYSLPILIVPSVVDAALYVLLWWHREVVMIRAALVLTVLLTMLWWRYAVKYYLRMPHADAVSASIIVVSFLMALAVFGVLDLAADLIWIWSADS